MIIVIEVQSVISRLSENILRDTSLSVRPSFMEFEQLFEGHMSIKCIRRIYIWVYSYSLLRNVKCFD